MENEIMANQEVIESVAKKNWFSGLTNWQKISLVSLGVGSIGALVYWTYKGVKKLIEKKKRVNVVPVENGHENGDDCGVEDDDLDFPVVPDLEDDE